MRRKTTLLEENLCFLGYRLDHKTYSGKKSDKVSGYVYLQNINNDVFYVYLNRERTKINEYSFTSRKYEQYNRDTIEEIEKVYNSLTNQLSGAYDFEKEEAKNIPTIDLGDMIDPFVEESVFDD